MDRGGGFVLAVACRSALMLVAMPDPPGMASAYNAGSKGPCGRGEVRPRANLPSLSFCTRGSLFRCLQAAEEQLHQFQFGF
jgi:hypothetical protein